MKNTILFLGLFTSFSSFACIDIDSNLKICPNDIVYKGVDYKEGARVIAVNPRKETVTVKSIYSGSMGVESLEDLSLTVGCVQGVCVGETIFKDDMYRSGARVVAVNPKQGTVVVKSVYSGSLEVENPLNLSLPNGCVNNICVGETIFKGDHYKNGATVVAVNKGNKSLVVRSNYNNNLFGESAKIVDVTKGCIEGICVGDTIFKGTDYKEGAKVIAINKRRGMAVIRSNYSGNIFVESARDLDIADMCLDYDSER